MQDRFCIIRQGSLWNYRTDSSLPQSYEESKCRSTDETLETKAVLGRGASGFTAGLESLILNDVWNDLKCLRFNKFVTVYLSCIFLFSNNFVVSKISMEEFYLNIFGVEKCNLR